MTDIRAFEGFHSRTANFISADTIIPGATNTQAYDRYAYSLNNPIKYTDPSGHYDDMGNAGSYYGNKNVYESIGLGKKISYSLRLHYPVETGSSYPGDENQPGSDNAPRMYALPFDESTPIISWWGFGKNDFTHDHPEYYTRTGHIHPGVDWGIPAGTELRWTVERPGIVFSKGEEYGAKDNIVIWSGGFLYLYGHISSTPLEINEYVFPGDLIAFSGAPPEEPGNAHLHFEVRPAEYPTGVYINPLTVMVQSLMRDQFNLFNSGNGADYTYSGDNALSIMYYP